MSTHPPWLRRLASARDPEQGLSCCPWGSLPGERCWPSGERTFSAGFLRAGEKPLSPQTPSWGAGKSFPRKDEGRSGIRANTLSQLGGARAERKGPTCFCSCTVRAGFSKELLMNNECRLSQFYAVKILFSLSAFAILCAGVGYGLLKGSACVAPWWVHFLSLLRRRAVAQAKGTGFQRFSSLEKGRSPAPLTPLLPLVGVHGPTCFPHKTRHQAKSVDPRRAG